MTKVMMGISWIKPGDHSPLCEPAEVIDHAGIADAGVKNGWTQKHNAETPLPGCLLERLVALELGNRILHARIGARFRRGVITQQVIFALAQYVRAGHVQQECARADPRHKLRGCSPMTSAVIVQGQTSADTKAAGINDHICLA
jgi:hypothetical protein